ncbi:MULTISPECIES: Gfo/Idh/MocA family oxidoreductase [Pseudovibrio]|uniref:Predicted dehydrogenase n=1 Tax=Pseudovibrio ascidiaceicola TaxID=285279 RepID=A0A1I3VGI5_9HYPH|nr:MULTISPECIES: Gfo/Idh/MocA family oxidoreductase [Pseudovibrio]KZL16320.1 1,5-anhydro-D-fructose reductase [Pseudovibrio sp. Ad26]SFJ94498.1 Predicted dehydrogenase [Pseudovibrio ascidiaceicola]
MKYGIIGYGKMGMIRHKALIASGAGEAAKIYEINGNQEYKHLLVDTYDEIINDTNLDAVVICTPNYLNKQLTIAALSAGKHVFCEKPPAFSGDEVREIITTEEKSRKVLMYGFNHRHHGGSLRMIEEIQSGKFGRVLWMRGRYGKSVDEDYFTNWRADPKLAGGGILIDQGIHMLDLFLQVGGDFDEMHAFVSSLYWNIPDIEDNVFAIFRSSETGICASLHSTMTQWRHLFSFEVFLEKGYMVLNGLKTPSGTYGAEQLTIAQNRTKAPAANWEDEETHLYDVDHSWEHEMKNFISAINEESFTERRDSHEALRVMCLIDRIYDLERHEGKNLFNKLNGTN